MSTQVCSKDETKKFLETLSRMGVQKFTGFGLEVEFFSERQYPGRAPRKKGDAEGDQPVDLNQVALEDPARLEEEMIKQSDARGE